MLHELMQLWVINLQYDFAQIQLKGSHAHMQDSKIISILHCLEPIGSTMPKMADNDIQRIESEIHSQFSLSCEGQAYPTPKFR